METLGTYQSQNTQLVQDDLDTLIQRDEDNIKVDYSLSKDLTLKQKVIKNDLNLSEKKRSTDRVVIMEIDDEDSPNVRNS